MIIDYKLTHAGGVVKKVIKPFRAAIILILCLFPSFAGAHSFPFPRGLIEEVRFWKTVFGIYTSNRVVIYDSGHLGVVYQVVDFSTLNARKDLSAGEKSTLRARAIQLSTRKIAGSLRQIALNPDANTLTVEQLYHKSLFDELAEPNKFLNAAGRIRVQMGQKDRLVEAMAKSRDWMGDIQAIFEKEGLPKELTALIFVESMFNPKAMSGAGASGLWQFMPTTGRDYLAINSFWDGRNDPIHSSWAAAQFLKRLYQQMGDWALAVNAYHSGPARILKAVKQLGTKDIAEIIARFDDPAYQFYSRNYYPQFLAMVEIYQYRDEYLGPLPEGTPLRYDIVLTRDFANLPQLAKRFAIDLKLIRELNTALSPEVMNGRLPLPPNFSLRVPKGYGYYLAKAVGYAPE